MAAVATARKITPGLGLMSCKRRTVIYFSRGDVCSAEIERKMVLVLNLITEKCGCKLKMSVKTFLLIKKHFNPYATSHSKTVPKLRSTTDPISCNPCPNFPTPPPNNVRSVCRRFFLAYIIGVRL